MNECCLQNMRRISANQVCLPEVHYEPYNTFIATAVLGSATEPAVSIAAVRYSSSVSEIENPVRRGWSERPSSTRCTGMTRLTLCLLSRGQLRQILLPFQQTDLASDTVIAWIFLHYLDASFGDAVKAQMITVSC